MSDEFLKATMTPAQRAEWETFTEEERAVVRRQLREFLADCSPVREHPMRRAADGHVHLWRSDGTCAICPARR